MARALHVVGDPAPPVDADPEGDLKFLFEREALLATEQVAVRAGLADARVAYSAKHGLQALPRMELLRERFKPQPKGRER